MRLLSFLAVAFLLSLAAARGGEARAARPPAPCLAAGAVEASIAVVQAKPESWIGRCVRLRGIAARGRLYASREALAELVRPYRAAAKGSIVIYPTRQASAPVRAASVELVGRVGSCAYAHEAVAELQAAEPGTIVMVGGYCHTSIETYVEPVAVRRLGGPRVQRLVEADLPEARRALVAAPPGLPDAEAHLAAVRRLVAAVAAGDEAGFRRLAAPETQKQLDQLRGAPPPAWLKEDLAESRRLFVALAGDGALRTLREWTLFVERDRLEDWRRDKKDTPDEIVACGCRTAGCAGRWPVTPLDADRHPGRPYFCLRSVAERDPRRPTAIRIDLDQPDYGFEEPLWEPRVARQSPS